MTPPTKKLYIAILLILLSASFLSIYIKQAEAVTYYNYTFTGPTYDYSAVPYNGATTVTLTYANMSTYSFTLQATGYVADTKYISSTNRIIQAVWNATTSPSANLTRIYSYFQDTRDDNTTLQVRVMDPTQAYYQYTFSIADFYGMTNPFLETILYNEGYTYVVERQNLNIGVVSFLMTQYTPYKLSFVCDQGTYTQDFTPGSTYAINLQVLSGFFPSTVTNDSLATATRSNATTLGITYFDPDSETDWLYVTISHQDGTYLIIDDSHNYTSSANSVTRILTVDNETDYYVQVLAYRYGGVIEWDFACPILHATNPFTGLLDFLGTWPTGFDPAQIFAATIIMCALGLGSFRSAGVSCVLAWIIAGIMLAIGWFTISVPMLALAGVLSVLVVLTEGKETTRDV